MWLSVGAVCAFVLGWEAAHRLGWLNPVLLSSPTRIADEGWRLLSTGALTADLVFTLEVFCVSVIAAVVTGMLVGFAIGYSALAYHVMNPFIVTANSLPKIVLMPLIVLWLGIGMSANVFLATLMASFPVITSTYAGVKTLDRDYVLLARSFGASRGHMMRAIVLPGITPYVLSGLRVGISYAMVGALIAEFFASSKGVGYRMVLFMSNFQVDAFFVCMTMVAVFTLACTSLVHWLERRVDAWRPSAFRSARGL